MPIACFSFEIFWSSFYKLKYMIWSINKFSQFKIIKVLTVNIRQINGFESEGALLISLGGMLLPAGIYTWFTCSKLIIEILEQDVKYVQS